MARVKEQQASYTTRKSVYKRPNLGTPKQTALKAVSRMKSDASYKDIIYELYVLQRIEEGERDIRDGRVLSHAQMKKALGKWLK